VRAHGHTAHTVRLKGQGLDKKKKKKKRAKVKVGLWSPEVRRRWLVGKNIKIIIIIIIITKPSARSKGWGDGRGEGSLLPVCFKSGRGG